MALPLNGGQLASDVRTRTRQGIVGGRASSDYNDRIDTLINSDPHAKQVDTITIDSAVADTVYTVSVVGQTITYTSDSTPTTTEIAADLAAAIAADPIAGGRVSVSAALAVITVTGRNFGDTYTVTDSDANITTASVTAGASASAVNFGRAMACKSYGTNEAYKQGTVPYTTFFSAQVATVDYTYEGTKTLGVRITNLHTGQRYEAVHTQATDKDTSTTALAAEVNAIMPANTVIAANAGATGYELTLTAEVRGLEFSVEVFSDDNTNVDPSVAATTGPSPSTSILRAFAGVSLYSEDEEATVQDGATASYPANAGVNVIEKGDVWVANSQSVALDDLVYVELDGTSDDKGKLFNSSSSTRLALPRSMARWQRASTEGDLAVVSVDALNRPA